MVSVLHLMLNEKVEGTDRKMGRGADAILQATRTLLDVETVLITLQDRGRIVLPNTTGDIVPGVALQTRPKPLTDHNRNYIQKQARTSGPSRVAQACASQGRGIDTRSRRQ